MHIFEVECIYLNKDRSYLKRKSIKYNSIAEAVAVLDRTEKEKEDVLLILRRIEPDGTEYLISTSLK